MKNFLDRSNLLDATVIDDRGLVSKGKGIGEIMGDHHKRRPCFLVKGLEGATDIFPKVGIQCGEGLVQKKNAWLHRQSPGESHPLFFSSTQIAWKSVQEVT